MKYLDFLGLSYLVENIKNTFSKIGHTHTKSDITALIIDSALSNSSTNAVENKVVQAAISIKANQSDLDTHVNNVENPVDLLYSFRDEYKTKENSIAYDIIYDAILSVSDFGYIPSLNDDKDNLKNLLFIETLKEKISAGENVNDLVESFINSTTSKRK